MPTYKQPNVLLVGHELFLGRRILEALKQSGSRVLLTDTDFLDLAKTKEFFAHERPEVVIFCDIDTSGLHYLQGHPGDIFFQSTLRSLHLQEAARLSGVKKFINLMANFTYPETSEKLKEEQWWNGPFYETVSVIGLVRKSSWVNAYAYHTQYGLSYANLILSNIYGPGDYFDEARSYAMGALLSKIVKAKQENARQVVVWGTGKPVRDWLYIDDAVEAILRSIEVDIGIEPVNIGTGKGVSIADLVQLIAEQVGYSGAFVFDSTRPDGTAYRVMDTKRARTRLRWQAATDLRQGISQTIQWYRTHQS